MTDFMYEGFLTSSDCAQVHNDPVQFQISTQHTGESGELVEFANPDIQIAIRIPVIIPYGTNAGFPVSYLYAYTISKESTTLLNQTF